MVRVNKIRFRTSIELPTRWALMIDDNIMKPQRRKRNSSESKGETNVNETPVWFNSELKHSFISLNSISFFCLFYFNRQLLKDFWKENKTQQKLYFFFTKKKQKTSRLELIGLKRTFWKAPVRFPFDRWLTYCLFLGQLLLFQTLPSLFAVFLAES